MFHSVTNHWSELPWSLMLDGVTSFLCILNIRITLTSCVSQKYLWDSSVQWRKVGRIWGIQLLFHDFLCVRIELDKLYCMNCWVINHGLSLSCNTHVIYCTLQLTDKPWFITQQFTARADLFLKYRVHSMDGLQGQTWLCFCLSLKHQLFKFDTNFALWWV